MEDLVRQVVLIQNDLVAILADDMHSSSIVKVLSRRDDTSQLEEVYSMSGLGMIVRLMYTTTGLILFETGDGTIYNLGDPKSTQTSLSPSPITRLPTRCPWIGFATVDNHVPSFPLFGIDGVGYSVWVDCTWQITRKQSSPVAV